MAGLATGLIVSLILLAFALNQRTCREALKWRGQSAVAVRAKTKQEMDQAAAAEAEREGRGS